MTTSISETPAIGLGRFIKENRFIVPTHQRDFSWTEFYVNAFIRDIEEAKKTKNDIYFCGLMVFTRSSTQVLKVLDGQQRLATSIMIFSAIRNWLKSYSDYKKHEVQIDTQLLRDDDIGAVQVEPKLILTPANNDTFQRFVISSVPAADIERALKGRPLEDRNKTLLKAALLINRYIEKKAEDFINRDEARDYFVELIRYITDTVKVVRFILNSDNAAYTIFETLNDRGLALAPLDLVKNYLFSRAETYRVGALKDFEERWSEMMTLLGSMKVDSFLRAFWASRHGTMEGTKLFGAFKKQYETAEKVYSVSVEMRGAAERYASLSSSSDPFWSDYSGEDRARLDAIETIGSSQMHPILLSAVEKFSKKELVRLLRLLEVIAVRFQLVGRGRPGRIESLGGRTAREIWENRVTSASQVRDALSELYASDDEFKQKFRQKTENDSRKARYILTAIEKQSLRRDGRTYAEELIPGDVTLEHVFPKSPNSYWVEQAKNDTKLRSMLNRLGNLCLLTDVNRTLGNRSWEEKVEAFGKSRLRTTNTIAEYPSWGSAAIEKRQGYMADLAAAIWRFE